MGWLALVAVVVVLAVLLPPCLGGATYSAKRSGSGSGSEPNANANATGLGPGSYYSSINTALNGTAFQAQLHNLISDHSSLSYNALWNAFQLLDENGDGSNSQCGMDTIGDIYSAKCWTPFTSQCGNYKVEGDCYNREHSWPKSWWGGNENAAYTDLFHLFASDGYDNGRRANVPLGTVAKPVYRTSDGAKLGPCSAAGFTGTCFEPADRVKGMLARGYFYVSTAYMNSFSCCSESGVDESRIRPWLVSLLRRWHETFPVSDYELSRNDMVFSKFQYNRNPFIDYPDWADKIDFSVS